MSPAASPRRCCALLPVLAATVLPTPAMAASSLDLRVAKGMRERGYDAVRISVMDMGTTDVGTFFDYNAGFQDKWTRMNLHSTIVSVPNGSATFEIAGEKVTIRLPKEGARARGLLLADPCISSRDFPCPFKDVFKITERLPAIINTVVGSDDIDFWGILGDNFYEVQFPPVGQMFFKDISLEVKAKPFMSVPGNHDFWISGMPGGAAVTDQLGMGFMQYYGQDTEAGLQGTTPYDFSADPKQKQIAGIKNFQFAHQVGDIAFFGYSGAHTYGELRPYVDKFCQWMENASTVNTAMILGHWNVENLGCTRGMSAPDVYGLMKTLNGCKNKTLLYVDGHDHCNHVTEKDHGFMIGANGMDGCKQFGFIVVDSDPNTYKGSNVRVDYFEVASMIQNGSTWVTQDNFDEMYSCLQDKGYMGCRDNFSQSWRAVPQPPTTQPPPATTSPPTTSASPTPAKTGPSGLAIAGIVAAVLASAAVGGYGIVRCASGRRSQGSRQAARVELLEG